MAKLASTPLSTQPDATLRDVLAFLDAHQGIGDGTVLVTITGLEGGAPRSLGSMMGVASDGSYVGSISSGCFEAAVVAEALGVLRSGCPRSVRFGAGSPYLDIVLPCGGGIDLLFVPQPDRNMSTTAIELLDGHRPVLIEQDRVTGKMACCPAPPGVVTGWRGDYFIVWHPPVLTLLIVGHGSHCLELARLALAYGANVKLLSPDRVLLDLAIAVGATVGFLKTPDPTDQIDADRWTAIVFMFHDHDWEPALLAQALTQPAFMVGAMGSRNTHARRIELLRARGVDDRLIERIEAPLGLVPLARDAKLLALSTLAQVADRFRDVIP